MPENGLNPAERLRRKNAFDASLTLGVEPFHRATGRDKHRAARFDHLLDPTNGLLKTELAQDRECPVCGGRWTASLFVKDGFPHGRCDGCGLIYVNPVLLDQNILKHYQEETSWGQVLSSEPQVQLDRLKYSYGLDVVEPYRDGPRVLDVGAGTGLFLQVARERGLEVMGQELNLGQVALMREAGLPVIDQPLDAAELEADSFDLVTLWEVLEHLPAPYDLLQEIGRVTRSGGLLLILVPNVDSLATRLLHEKSGTFAGHSHLNHFNLATLSLLLGSAGFEVVEAETIITELGTIDNHLNFEDPYLGRAETVLDFLTPKMIHDRLLGSKLLVLALNGKHEENP